MSHCIACISAYYFHFLTCEIVGFEVLLAADVKLTVFWVVTLCSLVEVYLHFKVLDLALIVFITLMLEAASASDTSLSSYQITLCNNTEDSHLHL
jgi:hypothetical protein